jgi:ABC-type glycerol-3-phosphate transport system permease component
VSTSYKLSKFFKQYGVWLPLGVLFLWTVLPLIWLVSSTFKPPLELYDIPPHIIPQDFTVEAYGDVLGRERFFRFVGNSVFLAVTSTAVTLFLATLAAYGFARYAFRWRHVLLILILVPRILPRAGLIVPLYNFYVSVGLIDTYTGIIIAYVASAVPFSTWIFTGFIQGVPTEYEEAAMVDGASFWRKLWHVILPVALPGLVTITVVSFLMAWNEFPFVLAFTTSGDMRTLPYQLYLMQDTLGLMDWPQVNAFAVFTILPVLLLYLLFEKNIVQGLTAGSIKG